MHRLIGTLLAVLLCSLAQAQDAPALRASLLTFPAPPTQATHLSVVAVGDVLLHTPLHKQMLTAPIRRHRSSVVKREALVRTALSSAQQFEAV